ncbi:MAG: polysaccharide deacetylase family protein, partial [Desulfobacteraceae bacterium]
MNIRSVLKLNRLHRWIKAKIHAKALILLYHRIATPPIDPQLLAVAQAHFEQHLDVICKYYHPLSLNDLCRAIQTKAVPPHSIVITFDDGYSDNLYAAKPLLEKYNIPATVFVTGGLIGPSASLWWDELARIFLQPGPLPRVLELTINDQFHHWEINDFFPADSEKHEIRKQWNVLEESDPGSRQTVYRSLYSIIRNLSSRET